MDLQELISRGRFLMARAPGRLHVFELVNGKTDAKQIARALKRNVKSVQNVLALLSDAGLIAKRTDADGKLVKRDGCAVYQKVPLARTVSPSYFREPTSALPSRARTSPTAHPGQRTRAKRPGPLRVPTERGLLDICTAGEGQIHEFKGQGVEATKISREICAMLNTREGGLILYGVADDGKVQGADMTAQAFDQQIQNSVRDTIEPPATVKIASVPAMGTEVFVIVVPPWNRNDVFQYGGRVYLRRGTNAVFAKAAETRKLHRGQYVV